VYLVIDTYKGEMSSVTLHYGARSLPFRGAAAVTFQKCQKRALTRLHNLWLPTALLYTIDDDVPDFVVGVFPSLS
jgi:hypothetical protein